jgi:hypothetical protein
MNFAVYSVVRRHHDGSGTFVAAAALLVDGAFAARHGSGWGGRTGKSCDGATHRLKWLRHRRN